MRAQGGQSRYRHRRLPEGAHLRCQGPLRPLRTRPRLHDQGGQDRQRRRTRSRSEEHTSELQSLRHLVCRLLLEKKKTMRARAQIRDERGAHAHAGNDHSVHQLSAAIFRLSAVKAGDGCEFLNDTAPPEIYTLPLHDALPISLVVGSFVPSIWHQQVALPSGGELPRPAKRSEEHTSELQSLRHLVCRLLL